MFDLNTEEKDSKVVIIPAPFEGTVTYGKGTSKGPEQIREASSQLDLFHHDFPDSYKQGIWMAPQVSFDSIYEQTLAWLKKDKYVCLLGGEHSVSYPAIKAFTEFHGEFGILHLDAHMDLRKAYLGEDESHASVMYNVMKLKNITQLTQVAIRDFCDEEFDRAKADKRITVFFDSWLSEQGFIGRNWHDICQEIIATLPDKIYVTCDVDGFDPKLCPNTGTPVPGGIGFNQWNYLLKEVVKSGRKIIGVDLVEVSCGNSNSDWDANVGARILYQLIVCGLESVKK